MGRAPRAAVLPLVLLLAGCAGGGGGSGPAPRAQDGPRPGTVPVALHFVEAWENLAGLPYYPFEGLSGCAFTSDGTLIVCDDVRGKVHGLDPGTRRWYEFDVPPGRPYRPLDAVVDGFKVLVLDRGTAALYRFDLQGTYLDRLLDVAHVDPAVRTDPEALALDRDGRLAITDAAAQEVQLLDAFLAPQVRLGGPGLADDQFSDPQGLVYLGDGRLVVADRGNRRLSLWDRLGFFERVVGGDLDPDNPFVAPRGLARDRHGNIFVADGGSGLIHVLDRRLELQFSAGAGFVGEGVPQVPVDVAVGPDGTLAVTDRQRAAVLIYRIVYE